MRWVALLLVLAVPAWASNMQNRADVLTSDSDLTCDEASITDSEAVVLTLPSFDNTGRQTVIAASLGISCDTSAALLTFNLDLGETTVETWTHTCPASGAATVAIAWRDTANSAGHAWTLTATAASGTHTLDACAITRSTHLS